jgi:hypothetical protein
MDDRPSNDPGATEGDREAAGASERLRDPKKAVAS